MTRLESRARRHAAQQGIRIGPAHPDPMQHRAGCGVWDKFPCSCGGRVDIVAVEDALARRTFPKLPRRGGVTALARAVVLEVRSGHADEAYALTRQLVEVARISGRTA